MFFHYQIEFILKRFDNVPFDDGSSTLGEIGGIMLTNHTRNRAS